MKEIQLYNQLKRCCYPFEVKIAQTVGIDNFNEQEFINKNNINISNLVGDIINLVERHVPKFLLENQYYSYILNNDIPQVYRYAANDATIISKFINHPNNAFLLVYRTATVWNRLFQQELPFELFKTLIYQYEQGKNHIWSDTEDILGANEAFERLRKFTDIDVFNIINGCIIPISNTIKIPEIQDILDKIIPYYLDISSDKSEEQTKKCKIYDRKDIKTNKSKGYCKASSWQNRENNYKGSLSNEFKKEFDSDSLNHLIDMPYNCLNLRDRSNKENIDNSLSAYLAFEIGKQSYNNGSFYGAKKWIMAALEITTKEIPDTSNKLFDYYNKLYDNNKLGRSEIIGALNYLCWTFYKLFKFKEAILINKHLIELEPHEPRWYSDLSFLKEAQKIYKEPTEKDLNINTLNYDFPFDIDNLGYNVVNKKLENLKRLNMVFDLDTYFENENNKNYVKNLMLDKHNNGTLILNFEITIAKYICKNGYLFKDSKIVDDELMCYLEFGYNKRLKNHKMYPSLGPYKVEQIYQSPNVYIWHGFLNDRELKILKEISIAQQARAVIHNPRTGKLEHANYRISKSSWHSPESNPVVKKVRDMVEDISGLSLRKSEQLQTQNYGLGGYYDVHYDYATKSQMLVNTYNENGNRIATVLIYMSDVEMGGETVFTRLGVRVKPKKGNVLFWRNLHPDGTGDAKTRHIACPVIYGTKWVSNHWIRIGDQYFEKSNPILEDGI